MPILEVKKVKKIYKNGDHEVIALNDITLSVEKGEFIETLKTGMLAEKSL